MSYSVRKRKESYFIYEKETNQMIYKSENESVARRYCRALNLGSGFNGYTPCFFTQTFSYKQKERPSRI